MVDPFGKLRPTMHDDLKKQIRENRLRLGNPYAHLNDDGQFDALAASSTTDVHDQRRKLQNPYAFLDDKGGYNEFTDANKSVNLEPLISATSLVRGLSKGSRLSRSDIEAIVRRLQNGMWKKRSEIFPDSEDVRTRDMLNSFIALQCVGFRPELVDSLGQSSHDGELFEVAGIIDRSESRVQISRRFSPDIRNFTSAHELGHAILHEGTGLHRDRALDGTAIGSTRSPEEWEADIFAVYFLMPGKQVRMAFEQAFGCEQFSLNDATAFALTGGSLDALERTCRTERDLSRMLAAAESYDSTHFHSLANQFGVSVETMAIRLEELKLLRR